ncbi:uncharacterized protein [Solanum lycopersicum]|uniref:uncharacterized protein n=1 Tax=Solanum lycopersicum TaxID=4081 RepID=UPI00374857A7
MNLRQGNRIVQEYGLKFIQLSRHAPHMVADSRARMNKFFYGVPTLIKTECKNAMLLGDMNISWYAQKGRAEGYKSKGAVSSTMTYPTFPKCIKNNPGECLTGKEGCFGFGQSSHRLSDCPFRQEQRGGNCSSQSTTSAATSSHPTQHGNSSDTRGGQRQNRLYAVQAC